MFQEHLEEMSKFELKNRIYALERISQDLHWMARRYADGRSIYATSLFNQRTRQLIEMDVLDLNHSGGDGTVWASDGMGK